MKKIALIILTLVLTASCSDDNSTNNELPPVETEVGTLQLDFNNMVGDKMIDLTNNSNYTNSSKENYSIEDFKYIISNVVLYKDNGESFTYPVADNYNIVKENDDASKSIKLSNIPVGEYTSIKFGIGVDQSKYPLDDSINFIPAAQDNGLYWSWATGYIFMKLDGKFTPSAGGIEEAYKFHIGSLGTNLDLYNEIKLDLATTPLAITDKNSAKIIINADVAKLFDGKNTYSLIEDAKDVTMDATNAKKVGDNITGVFSLNSVTN